MPKSLDDRSRPQKRMIALPADTIAALSSGSLPSGIAVLRVSGPVARTVATRLAGDLPPDRRASLRRLRDAEGATLDRAIVLSFDGPNTVTGEDLVEFHLHGGRAVVSSVLDAITAIDGVRLAQAGEFTRRAFENGRIDLTEAEGLGDLITAATEGQRKLALAEAGGRLRDLYESWSMRLTRIRAMIEASFDFADEDDVDPNVAVGIDRDIAALADEMSVHLATFHRGEVLRHGFKVVIVGAPNAGKSSLLNALADREVAIVTEIPGTTRDVIEVTLDLAGIPVRLSDTAGMRVTDDTVEAIGVERARKAMDDADLVLALVEPHENGDLLTQTGDLLTHVKQIAPFGEIDAAATSNKSRLEEQAQGRRCILVIRTKIDRPEPEDVSALIGRQRTGGAFDAAISVKTGEGMAELVERIGALAKDAAGDSDATPLRTRHRAPIAEALRLLGEFRAVPDAPLEMRAETLRLTADRLGALTGRVGVEDLLDVVFSQFCIGK